MQKQKFLDPEKLLLEAGLKSGLTVADLGCGNGFFTLPAAKIVGDSGKVWAVDVLEDTLSKVMSLVRINRHKNVRTLHYDLESGRASSIGDLACDFAIIGKVLPQLQQPQNFIREVYRILKTGALVLLVEWKKQQSSIGPSYESRMTEEAASGLFTKQGFKLVKALPADSYHYALLLQK
ncbi:MAG: class I SAM-dependent methyltransferase [Patescibacteria group bacterium]|nr:class I SAM-dependent methyltransferase [Patescibacteria group bacterium]